ncbi:MAG TPA: ribbon-helix-helix protein, CopG family [Pyrodictiaceae archaeon]|nr:ribbon-helix-helix protein, CopG family [Pyrodictiaceae archaeon]HIP85558.1 ribbon-helix-helix protein, CopG family [Pyrodictium sp.]HIQ11064.1 ribbon-helix-helix protein, CopG family [Pyrodictium sp.]HIQ56332.1 ribbon-helix-helix protein, CopG family [Pyrodictium sp.]
MIVTFKAPIDLVHKLDELIEKGIFSSRSEALRRALALLIAEYSEVEYATVTRRSECTKEIEKGDGTAQCRRT